jgi:hypothetical protein
MADKDSTTPPKDPATDPTGGGRRQTDRRRANQAFDGDDRRKAERRSGTDRRAAPRLDGLD